MYITVQEQVFMMLKKAIKLKWKEVFFNTMVLLKLKQWQ